MNVSRTLASDLCLVVSRWTRQTLENIAPYDNVKPSDKIHLRKVHIIGNTDSGTNCPSSPIKKMEAKQRQNPINIRVLVTGCESSITLKSSKEKVLLVKNTDSKSQLFFVTL